MDLIEVGGMAETKTQMTDASVAAFIESVEPPAKREDAKVLDALFRRVTGEAPRLWGPTIIGYGEYRTTYETGREVDRVPPVAETRGGHTVDRVALRAENLGCFGHGPALLHGTARAAAGLARSQSWIGCHGPKRCCSAGKGPTKGG